MSTSARSAKTSPCASRPGLFAESDGFTSQPLRLRVVASTCERLGHDLPPEHLFPHHAARRRAPTRGRAQAAGLVEVGRARTAPVPEGGQRSAIQVLSPRPLDPQAATLQRPNSSAAAGSPAQARPRPIEAVMFASRTPPPRSASSARAARGSRRRASSKRPSIASDRPDRHGRSGPVRLVPHARRAMRAAPERRSAEERQAARAPIGAGGL